MLKKFSAEHRFDCGLDEIVRGNVWAFVPVTCKHGIGLGVAVANEPGYYPVPFDFCHAATWAEMSKHADELNLAEGVDEESAARIICSSMAAGNRRKGRGR